MGRPGLPAMPSLRSLPLPREHGAWGMLIAGALIAWSHPGVAGLPSAAVILLFAAAFALQELLRAAIVGRRTAALRWVVAYGAVLVATAGWLLLVHQLWVLVPAAVYGGLVSAFDLMARRRGASRSAAIRLAGGSALTLVLPGALCVVHPQWAMHAAVLWAVTVAYFAIRLVAVRARFAEPTQPGRARRWRTAALACHAGTMAAIALLATCGVASPWLVAAFLPAVIRDALPPRSVTARRTGWIEVALLGWFVIATVASFHFPAAVVPVQ